MNTGWPWVVDLPARRSLLTPDLRAVYDRSARSWYTFKDLNFRANKLANYLKDELGLVEGDRAAILARNRIECFDLFFATQKTNIISFPLNVRLSSTEMDELLAQAEPRVLFFENALEEKAASLTFPFETKVRVGTAKSKILKAEDYEAILQSSSACAPQANQFSLHDTHLLLSTGGTTGLPKLAMIPHRMVYMNIINEIMSWNITGGDSATIVLPLFHTGGWHILTLPILAMGGRIIIDSVFDPEWVLKMIEQERTSFFFAAPTMFSMLSECASFNGADLSSLRMVMAGAAPCPVEIMEQYWDKGVPFVKGYGLTEAGPNNISMLWEHMDREMVIKKFASVGVPFLYSPVRFLDEHGQEVPPYGVGEVCIGGPQIFSGYWRNEKATVETIIDGWFHTGDLARYDEDGFVYIVDRKKDMFISGGENVYPAEIEAVLTSHPLVSEASVIGVPDSKWGEVGMAFLVLRAPGLSPEKAICFCRKNMAGYKVPKYIQIVDSLPRNSLGKVLKKELRNLYRKQGEL